MDPALHSGVDFIEATAAAGDWKMPVFNSNGPVSFGTRALTRSRWRFAWLIVPLGGSCLLPTYAMAADEITAAAATASNAVPPGASNDGGRALEEVTVTAEKVTPLITPLQAQKDIPKSISIVSGQEIQALQALSVTEVLNRIGNTQWNYGNPMTGSLSIRGVSSSGGGTIDPSLGTTVDGVPLASTEIASELDYVDVSTISVTRGPQGSTGGLNNTMGTIEVINNAPRFTDEAFGSLTLGIRSAVVAQGVIGGPVIDDLLAWRATFYRDQENGPYNNAYPGNEGRYSWDNTDRTLGRLQLLLTPTDDLHALLSVTSKPNGTEFVNGLTQALQEPATYADGKPTYVANGLAGATNTTQNKYTRSWFTSQDPNAYQNYLASPVNDNDEKGVLNATYGGVFHVTWDQPWGTLQSISGFDTQHFQASNGVSEWQVTYDGGSDMKYRQASEELKITSKPGGFLDYTAGLFYLQSSDWNNSASYRAIYGSDAGAYDANAAQYAALDATPAGIELMQNSLNGVRAYGVASNFNRTEAAFGQINWHLASPLTLTTGIRLSGEDRHTSQNKGVSYDGSGAALDPGAYGGFNTNAAGALTASNTAAQIALANSLAQQYFGVSTYSALTATQQAQVAAAKGIRQSTVYTGLFGTRAARPYKGWLPSGNVSVSYQLRPDLTTYLTWEHGVKAGISQLASIGGAIQSYPVKPESSNDYEIGFKGTYFNSLTANLNYYLDYINNYQQTVYVYDSVLSAQNGTNTYDSLTGNAPGIETSGVELDAAFDGIKNLTLRFAGDYNHVFYNKDVLLSNAVEYGDISPAYHDAKGQWLANAPRFTGNLSGEYAIPVLSSQIFHANFNYHYSSRFNSDSSGLSEYAWVGGHGTADFGIGIGRGDRRFDVTLLVKNATNTSYRLSQTWTSFTPGLPRWYGITFSGRL
jgi:outer membrane receptor protein involved in Fe transport